MSEQCRRNRVTSCVRYSGSVCWCQRRPSAAHNW